MTDEETSEILISGMGELHLEVYIERMKREYKADVEVGAPRVAYRETILQPAAGEPRQCPPPAAKRVRRHLGEHGTGGERRFGIRRREVEPQRFQSGVGGFGVGEEGVPAIPVGQMTIDACCHFAVRSYQGFFRHLPGTPG